MEDSLQLFTSSKFRIGWHILFWSVAVIFMTFFFGHQQQQYEYTFYFVLILLPITMLTTYAIIYFLIPRFLLTKKYFGFVSRTAFIILISVYLGTMAIFMMLFFFIYGDGPPMDASTIDIYFLAVGMYFIILIAVVIKLFKFWYEKQKTQGRLETEKLQAELNMLKSQIHPHFLFNTLNNIYALALQKSDAAPEMLVKLSDILHYILYECNEPLVPLEKEVTLLQNYLELERIRYGKRLELTFELPATVPVCELAPMVLLPFVENAFKHGASKTRETATVDIRLEMEGSRLKFSVKNSKPAIRSEEIKSGGLGLKNVGQRLEMIYPGRHKLEINDGRREYAMQLDLETDSEKSNTRL